MTHGALVNYMLEKGMSYSEATAEAKRIEEKAQYLTKVFGTEITAEDLL